jgi:hypothetical protein
MQVALRAQIRVERVRFASCGGSMVVSPSHCAHAHSPGLTDLCWQKLHRFLGAGSTLHAVVVVGARNECGHDRKVSAGCLNRIVCECGRSRIDGTRHPTHQGALSSDRFGGRRAQIPLATGLAVRR